MTTGRYDDNLVLKAGRVKKDAPRDEKKPRKKKTKKAKAGRKGK